MLHSGCVAKGNLWKMYYNRPFPGSVMEHFPTAPAGSRTITASFLLIFTSACRNSYTTRLYHRYIEQFCEDGRSTMKIINIIGHSCSGKTTFISKLLVILKDTGRVATIKHLGHHNFSLEKGKDTTIFYECGVDISAGIDSEKTALSIRNNNLISILDLLADQGIEFTVIEGFKTIGLPAVVIGDLESDKVLFRNPTLDNVMNGLEQFPEYCTLKGVENELRTARSYPNGSGKTCLSKPDQSSNDLLMTVSVPANFSETQFAAGYKVFRKIAEEVTWEISHEYHPVLVSVGLRNCWSFSIHAEFLIAVITEDFETGSFVVSAVHERIKRKTAIVG